jgi:micrococcal nuclease
MFMSKRPSYFYKAKVVSVYDGDTCRVDIDAGFGIILKNKTIRLSNIDTAEIRSEDKESAIKARDRLRELVLDKEIILQTMKDRTGKYGRIIGILYLDGNNINDMLVEEGLAVRIVSRRRRNSKKKTQTEKKQVTESQAPTEQKEAKESNRSSDNQKKEPQEKEVAVKIEIPENLLKALSGSSE